MRRWRVGAEVAAADERARLARELHDVVTHHVTAMVVQADAAQYLLGSAPERAGDGLAAISDTGRRALRELRYLLGVLEAAVGPVAGADRTPALGRIRDLAEQARLAGQPVELVEYGEPRRRGVAVELAAYRVVQEALANAIEHAAGRPTVVVVRHHDDRVEIEVVGDGPPPAGGLARLRERVRMLEGELTAVGLADGRFRVRALIPAWSDS